MEEHPVDDVPRNSVAICGINDQPQLTHGLWEVILHQGNERVWSKLIRPSRRIMKQSVKVGKQAGLKTSPATSMDGIFRFLKWERTRLLIVRLWQSMDQQSATRETIREPPPQRLYEVRPSEVP